MRIYLSANYQLPQLQEIFRIVGMDRFEDAQREYSSKGFVECNNILSQLLENILSLPAPENNQRVLVEKTESIKPKLSMSR